VSSRTKGEQAAMKPTKRNAPFKSDVDRMAATSADKAAQYLSQFFANEGWISPDKVKKSLL
jgi:hypothetical protein